MSARAALRAGAVALAAVAGAGAAMALGSVAVVLLTHGVFATAAPAWTMPLRIAGITLRVNVPGALRLATAPSTARLLDGRSVTSSAGTVRFTRQGDVLVATCAPCRIEHPQLAREALLLETLTLTAARRDATIEGQLVSGAVRIAYSARIAADRVDVRWTLPRTDADAALRAVASVVPEARWGRIDGAIEASGSVTLPSLASSTQVHVDGLTVQDLGTAALEYGEFSFGCRQPDGRVRRSALGPANAQWLRLEQFGPHVPAAVIAAEDQRFHAHRGYDEDELAALLASMSAAGPARGASTLTQQVARTLYTGGERTAARKVRELLYAVEMEQTLGKSRILELYLNTVDWGPGICGARAAARTYFGKSPARLTPLEAAWLAGILRAPHAAHARQYLAGAPERARAQTVLRQMRELSLTERQLWSGAALELRPPAKRELAPTTQATLAVQVPQGLQTP